MAMKSESIKSLAHYAEAISKIAEAWSDSERGDVCLWCRGQSNSQWGLFPGQFRYPTINATEIASEFQLKARPFLTDPRPSNWEWYFLMQHYGLPTRLLDWTTGAFVALYFALRSNAGESDAAVWVLDPWALNKKSLGKDELVLCTEGAAQPYLTQIFGTTRKAKLPIAVAPPYNSQRITVQRGTFTIHGNDRRGLEGIPGNRLQKLIIPKDVALQVKRQLRASGTGEFTVFPDLDGLCREICAVELEGG